MAKTLHFTLINSKKKIDHNSKWMEKWHEILHVLKWIMFDGLLSFTWKKLKFSCCKIQETIGLFIHCLLLFIVILLLFTTRSAILLLRNAILSSNFMFWYCNWIFIIWLVFSYWSYCKNTLEKNTMVIHIVNFHFTLRILPKAFRKCFGISTYTDQSF